MKDQYSVECRGDVGGILYTMPFGDKTRLISHVWTNPHSLNVEGGHRGHGHSKELLEQVTNDADKEGTTLHLQVGDGSMDTDLDRLAGLYKRFEFDWNDEIGGREEGAMTRYPKTNRKSALFPQ